MNKIKISLTRKELRELVKYDESTGVFTWLNKIDRNIKSERVGWFARGRQVMKIKGVHATAARFAWLYVHNEWPQCEIIHVNGDSSDDRIENLASSKDWYSIPLTQDRLKTLVFYNAENGIFTWRQGRMKGKKAGYVSDGGYNILSFAGKDYRAHWLVWLYVYGYLPNQIDHINGDRADNRLSNLREATQYLNMANSKKPTTNKSGYKGVSWSKVAKAWQAHIKNNGKNHYLGLFEDPKTAHDAYCKAASIMKGEFARFD